MITCAPPNSSSLIVAKPIDGRIRSTRQVTKNPTRMMVSERVRSVRARQSDNTHSHQLLGEDAEEQQREPVERQQYPHVASRLERRLVHRLVEIHQLDDPQVV